ncbi:IscS subfamily cysteine desulfurase [Sphingobacterium sp. CZ-UAM]|uniref:cysteine desulfurase family protein n=1 Tax=Sphingobacterium sp. CZ-UAM TaxID=1933868 RepID=UPI000985A40E|nr:cysteine desulfurase family protein [Sphingobacterium sp. CZ-UAM]OOG19195.1 IscS subfamily cysteine desulfurase [Sphingobacterium sp. CZ-UAM]
MDNSNSNFIYLDYNATTPVDERVLHEMLPFFGSSYANPSGAHLFSLTVQDAVDQATAEIAYTLGTHAENIIYTSGATEAINLAIQGLQFSNRKHIVGIATEHKAVLETCAFMERLGFEISYLTVDEQGMPDLVLLTETIREDTALVCSMLVNNETGVVLPIKEIAEIAHQRNALVLCDATQAVGKMSVNTRELGVDLLAFSAHKFYGPKGIGGLYIGEQAKKVLSAIMQGGGQQQGWRGGTLNTTGIIGMAAALRIAVSELEQEQQRIGPLRDLLEIELLSIDGAFLNGSPIDRLYNTTNICFPGALSEQLIMRLGTISVSSGSACSAVTSRPSHVLKAMGLQDLDALSSIRFSLGRLTHEAEIYQTIERVKQHVQNLRNTH